MEKIYLMLMVLVGVTTCIMAIKLVSEVMDLIGRFTNKLDGEDVEEDKQRWDDGVDKRRRFGIPGIDRAHKVEHDHDPGHDPSNAAVNEGCPVRFLGVLVVQFHHDAEQVHRGVEGED